MDAGLREARRFGDLLLRVSLFDRFADQPVALGVQLPYAADFVPQLAKLGQRVLAGHLISSKLHALLVAITPLLVAQRDCFTGLDCRIG